MQPMGTEASFKAKLVGRLLRDQLLSTMMDFAARSNLTWTGCKQWIVILSLDAIIPDRLIRTGNCITSQRARICHHVAILILVMVL